MAEISWWVKKHEKEEFLSQYKKEFLYSENNDSLEQPLQGCGKIPDTGSFQDVIGQGAR